MKARRRIEEILRCVGIISGVIRGASDCGVMLADIGADHGWVSHFALARGFVSGCICTDIHDKSLEKARKLFDFNPELKKNVDFRVGDGFSVIDHVCDKVDICVIAGMGCAEILKIIGENKNNAGEIRFFVLQARYDEFFAKDLGARCGLDVVFDKAILDRGHVYRTIVAVDFANCTLQEACVCDKLKTAFDEACGKDLSSLGIDFDIFGKNNLFDSSKEHILALESLLESSKKLRSNLESNAKVDDGIAQRLEKRILELEKIIAYIKVQKP